jgi:hypothetical protein
LVILEESSGYNSFLSAVPVPGAAVIIIITELHVVPVQQCWGAPKAPERPRCTGTEGGIIV